MTGVSASTIRESMTNTRESMTITRESLTGQFEIPQLAPPVALQPLAKIGTNPGTSTILINVPQCAGVGSNSNH